MKQIFGIDKKVCILKVLACLVCMVFAVCGLFHTDFDKYYKYENIVKENQNTDNATAMTISEKEKVTQGFVAEGNLFISTSIYFQTEDKERTGELLVSLLNESGTVLEQVITDFSDVSSKKYHKIDFNVSIEKGKKYFVELALQNTKQRAFVLLTQRQEGEVETLCTVNGQEVDGAIVQQLCMAETSIGIVSLYEMFFLVLRFISLTGILCFGICKFEVLFRGRTKGEYIQGVPVAIFFALLSVMEFNPLAEGRTEVEEFKRVIGEGIINNYDCGRVTTNFTLWFILFVLLFGGFLGVVMYLYEKQWNEEQKKALAWFKKLLPLGYVSIGFRVISFFAETDKNVFHFSFSVFVILIICSLVFLLGKIGTKISFDCYKQIIFMLFLWSFPMGVILGEYWENGRILLDIFFSMIVVFWIFLWGIKKHFIGSHMEKLLQVAVRVSSIFPAVTFIYIEGICVLNQHNVFIGSPKVGYLLIIAGTVAVFGVLFWLLRKKEWAGKNSCYGITVFGIAFLTIQLPLATTTGRSLFEHANASVLISDFLNFGKIPIVEHYGGHMLSTVLEGYLYGWINNDHYGAIYTPYYAFTVPLIVVGFYLLLKQVLDEESAFWICLLIPFYDYWEYYGLGIFAILGFVWYIKKPSLKKAFLVWWICILCALYRLDVGMSFGGAVFIGIVFYCIIKKRSAIKQWIFSFLVSAIICVFAWMTSCLCAGVSPVERAVEFILISLSNENWAYESLGNTGLGLFSWSYVIVPFTVLLCMVYTVFCRSFREKIGEGRYYILLTLGAAYLFNFSRGLVRHNLVEMATNVIVWCGYIFIAIFLSCFWKKKEVFLYALVLLMIVNNSLLSTSGFSKEGILEKSVDKLGETAIGWPIGSGDGAGETWQTLKETKNKVSRIMPNADLQQKIERLNKIMNLVLDEKDTYLDFINESFLYSALERECPVYVSQSPGQLSGEFTQEKFIEQIQSKNNQIPLALMPTIWMQGLEIEIDGIANNTRYYKVAEYIYQNYRPLCRVDNVAIWCAKERYQEFYNLIGGNIEQYNAEENKEDVYEFIDWGYDGYQYIENEKGEKVITYAEYLHSYPQALLPYLWANSDKKEAKSRETLCELNKKENNVYVFSGSETIEKNNGNYLKFTCRYNGEDREGWESHGDEQCTVTLKLGKYTANEFEEKYQVKFNVKEGTHEYLIRISSDYYWYSENINAVKIDSKKQLNNKEMCIMAGD